MTQSTPRRSALLTSRASRGLRVAQLPAMVLATLVIVAACSDDPVAPITSDDALFNQAPNASEVSYELVDLGTLGGDASFALGLNNRGQVVGTSRTTGSPRPQIAFSWDRGTMELLGTLEGSTFSRAFRANNRGVAVGEAFTPSGDSRAIVWENGALRELPPRSGFSSAVANDVNDRGQVVGVSGGRAILWDEDEPRNLGAISSSSEATSRGNAIAANGLIAGTAQTDLISSFGSRVSHAFLWRNGRMIDLGALGQETNFSVAYGVNPRGEVVGESIVNGNTYHAFRWRNGRLEDLHPQELGLTHSRASDVNSSGQVVGWASSFHNFPTFGSAAALLWTGNEVVNLNEVVVDAPEWDLRAAMGINDGGRIVGYGLLDGQTRAFLLIPIQTNGQR
jgi:probable HAF family extracellular repeat protein